MAKPMIGVIINPKSRVNRRTNCASVKKFAKIAGDLGDIRATQTITELHEAIRDFRKRKYHYIGISGGDGTIHYVVTALINEFGRDVPPILLLRDGTMNNIASSIGLKLSSEAALRKLVHHLHHDKSVRVVQRDTIRIDKRYCFLFGFGLTTNILNEVYVYERKGFRENIRVIGKTFAETLMSIAKFDEKQLSVVKTMQAKITLDDEKVPFTRVLNVIGGTVENLGMGLSTLYRVRDVPGHFHVIISGMTPLQLVRELQKVMIGERIDHHLNVDEICRRMVVKSPVPFEYTMDGDMYRTDGKLVVEAGVPLRFVLPE